MTRLVCLLLSAVFASAASGPNLTVRVSSEAAPPGGYAQFKIGLTAPALVSSATIAMDFDPAILGPIASAAAFSATGDQIGYVNVQGMHLDAYVTSSAGALGQLPGLPVFVVTIPILVTAKVGATSSITFTASNWLDPQNNVYNVSVNQGTLTVGGSLSLQSVSPSGGLLPSGTVVTVNGTGFDSSTTVAIDGVVIASTQLITPQQINVTLGGATEMSAKHVHVSTPSGASVDYFASLWAPPAGGYLSALILPSLPSPSYTAVQWGFPVSTGLVQDYSCLQNPTAAAVTATYYFVDTRSQVTAQTIVIPPFGLYVANNLKFVAGLGSLRMTVSAPIRMAEYRIQIDGIPGPSFITVYPPTPMTNLDVFGVQSMPASSWTWQLGTPAPQPQKTSVFSGSPFTVSLAGGAEAWLKVTPTSGNSGSTQLTLTPVVSSLGAGIYTGTVTVTPILPPDLAQFGPGSQSFNVTLNANAQPTLLPADVPTFSMVLEGSTPAPVTVPIATNGPSAAFTTTLTPQSGGNWLAVTPSSGTTPASLTLTANPAGLAAGLYTTKLSIQGPINTVDLNIAFSIKDAAPGMLLVAPMSLSFLLHPGQADPAQAQTIAIRTPTPSVRVSSAHNPAEIG